LGNIWRFPYSAGENGGGLFVLIYLACVLIVGFPVMIAEIVIGRRAQKSPAGAFEKLGRQHGVAWSLVGWMGVAAGFLILSFYSVIAGWTMHYVYLGVTGAFQSTPVDEMKNLLGGIVESPKLSLLWHAVFMSVTMFVVLGGVKRGIEKAATILMPTLFGMMLLLVAYAATLSGFGEAMSFLFEPNMDKFSSKGALDGLGQGLFSLSLGMGALITYGSYLQKNADIAKSAAGISLLDTSVALLSGLIVFPLVFTAGQAPGAGPGLVFITLPSAFHDMGGGYILGIGFFVLLFFAALTSSISLLEVVCATVIDQLGWSRRQTTVTLGGAIFLLGVPSAVGEAGLMPWWKEFFGRGFLDSVDYITANWMLPVGAFLMAVYVGWFLKGDEVREEFMEGSSWGWLYGPWRFLIRYVVPLAILAVFVNSI